MKRLACLLLACLTALALAACGAKKPQEISLFAMDTYMTLAAYGDSADEALTAASREINRLEAILSRTIDTSDVSRLNAGETVAVQQETRELLTRALALADETGGTFDMTVAPLVALWGITSDAPHVPAQEEIDALLPLVGGEHVHMDGGVTLDEGCAVDLGGIRLKHLPIFLGSGLISILLLSVVYFQCQTMCSLSVAAVLLYLAPSFVVLASAVLWKTPLTMGKVAALCVSLLGCIMVSGVLGGDMTASWAGIGLGVVSGMCYASYTVFSHYGLARYESYTMIYWTFLVAGLGSVFFADIPALLPVFQQPKGIIGGIGVVIVATVLPYIFYTKGLEGVESGRASIITNIEPVVETLVGITVFHEALTVWTVLGVGCVIGCVALLAREGRHEREAAAE